MSNGKVDIELVPRGELTGTDSIRDPSVVGSMLVFVNAAGTVPYVYTLQQKSYLAKIVLKIALFFGLRCLAVLFGDDKIL